MESTNVDAAGACPSPGFRAPSSPTALGAGDGMSRRTFGRLGLILTPIVYAGALLGVAGRYLSPPPGKRRDERLEVGTVAALEEGAISSAVFNGRLIHVLCDSRGEVIALDATCTHSSCNVNWSAGEGCFICPCHAGRFDRDGNVTQRPPVLPLARQAFVVDGGKIILVDSPPAGGA